MVLGILASVLGMNDDHVGVFGDSQWTNKSGHAAANVAGVSPSIYVSREGDSALLPEEPQ